MPTYQLNISLIEGLPSTWAAAAWIHPCTGARLALTPHWASAAACRRGTRPPQVLRTQGAKGCSRRTGPISQRCYSTADRLAREGYRGSFGHGRDARRSGQPFEGRTEGTPSRSARAVLRPGRADEGAERRACPVQGRFGPSPDQAERHGAVQRG